MNGHRQPKREILPLLLIAFGFLMVAGVIFYVITSVDKNPAAATSAGENIPYPDMKRVTPQEAKAAFDSRSAVFVDVRDPDSYKEGHIPGAVNIPLNELENRTGELDPGQWIITYCT